MMMIWQAVGFVIACLSACMITVHSSLLKVRGCEIILTESRRDLELGGELDSQEEASPEETKSREVVLG